MANSLPKKLRVRLAELGRRLHRLHVIQGLCRIVVVVLAAALAAVLLDAAFRLSGWARGMLFGGWLILGLFEIRRFIRGPLSEPLDAEGLASAIEQEFPRLGERLTTAVELAGSDDPANGSPELIALVIKDAETRTRKLDLKRAAPATATILFAAAFIAAIFAVLVPLVAVPKAGEHARRFLAPWYAPKPEIAYSIKVTSGDPTVKRGEATTLAALIESTKANASLPSSATAVIKSEKGIERLPMIFDAEKREAYLTRGQLESGFEYQIVSGDAESEWHRVAVVDPVRLESSRITVVPPAYARKPGDVPVPSEGLAEMAALQYSRITFDLRFNRIPSAAWLEWKPEGSDVDSTKIPLSVDAEAIATLTVTALVNGKFRLHAEADKVRNSLHDQPLTVLIDLPPRFEKVAGFTAKTIRPTEKLPLEIAVADDIAVRKVEVEFRINGGPVQSLEVPLKGLGTPQAVGGYALDLAGKAKEGDRFEYRLAATDNRDLPEAKLTPQKTYYPENEKWAELRLNASAAPIKEQEINAKKDDVDARLKAILDALKIEQRIAYRLKIDTAKRVSLKQEQADKLAELQKNVFETGEIIDELARDIALTPELSRLAEAVREVGDREIRAADGALRQAQREEKPEARTKHLEKADESLVAAIRRFETLRKENEKLAKERLDKQKLEQIADDQKKLAEQTDKADEKTRDELQRQQKELEDKLKALQEDSEPLRNAVRNAQARRLDHLAKEAQRLERELRDLTEAMKEAERKDRDHRLADLLKKQLDLAKKAKELGEKTDTAARTAPLSPLNREEIDKATEALKNGNLNDAVLQQEKAAFELDRLARELEKAIARTKDPREAAKQLERLQEDLRRRVAETVKETPLEQLPPERREAFEKQQRAIRKAVEKLSIPATALEAEKTRKTAVEETVHAKESLGKLDAKTADERMRKAAESLAQLVEQLPTQEKRLTQARVEVAKLRQEQEAIARLAESATKQVDKLDPDAADTQAELKKKVADLAKRQAQAAETLSKIDLPGHEERREKSAETLRRAKDDLDSGRPQDIGASQQAARRELERLEQALDSRVPADEEADRLAKKQKQLAAEMKANAEKPDVSRTKALQSQQAEIAQDLGKLQAPEAPALKEDALELSRKPPNAKQAADTAQALQKLADRLNDRESAAEMADRLAKKQREAAEEAERLGKKKESIADAKKKAQQRLEETRNLRPGEDAQKEKQKALESLTHAQQANNPEQLARAEKEAADALQQLAEKLAKRQATEKPVPKSEPPEDREGMPNRAQAEEARKLAEEQRMLRDELARANEELNQNRPLPKEQAERQKELQKQIGGLTDQMKKMNRQMKEGPSAATTEEAAGKGEKADEAMKQAREQSAKGEKALARDAQEKAANALEQAGQRLKSASEQMAQKPLPGQPGQQGQQAGQSLQEARDRMDQAQKQLGQNEPKNAGQAMRQAADALKKASQQLGKPDPGQPGQGTSTPSGNDGSPKGQIDPSKLGPLAEKYKGKSWGELPGEIKNQIVSDMKARYGEDYARYIKLYFEQLAERK